MDRDKEIAPSPISASRPLAEAAAWRVRLTEDAGDVQMLEFEHWLAKGEENAAAWRQVEGVWQLFSEHPVSPELIDARKKALSRVQRVNRRRWLVSTGSNFRNAALGVAAGVLLLVGVTFFTWQYTRFDVYQTGPRERHTIGLADGSTVTLDAQSELRVRYTGSTRTLSLLRGQAQFDVAHDVERPFAVTARNRKVIATGTSFNVDMLDSNLFVTLIEGRVVIVPATAAASPSQTVTESGFQQQSQDDLRIELSAGQQAVISALAPTIVSQVNVSWATAWQTGRVIFENETLANAVARLNRYSNQQLQINDERTANRRISGVFKVGDIEGFVATVTAYLPVTARRISNGDISIRESQAE